jgi:hypothetical protein
MWRKFARVTNGFGGSSVEFVVLEGPHPNGSTKRQSLILAAQIVSSKRVWFCAPVVEKDA